MTTRASVDLTRFIKKLDNLDEVVIRESKVLVAQASEMGAEVARFQLDKAESPWGVGRMTGDYFGKKVSVHGNSTGRNDTGRMIDTLRATSDNSATRQRATFGWRQNIIAAFPYIKYQEEGFNNVWAGKWQKGVLSLKDGQKYVREQMPRLVGNMKQRIYRKMK